MATRVIMPKQGLQMTEGTITKWLKKEGEKVEEGKPLFEMETDKLNIEIDAPASGTLLKIIREEGDVVPITETIAVIGEPGEDISELLKECKSTDGKQEEQPSLEEGPREISNTERDTAEASNQRVTEGRIFSTPRARTVAEEKNINIEEVVGTGPEGLIIERDVKNYANNEAAQPKATPLARKIAQQNNIRLNDIDGTGTRGKVTKADVENAVNARINKLQGTKGERIIPFTGMRKAIAENMMKSLHGMAQANHRMKVDMTEVITMREKLKADGIKVSFTDIIVKIVSKALMDFPIINSSLTEEGIVLKEYVNMGIAVALDEGLIVPVIKNANLMTLSEISTVAAELIEKAKNGKLKPDEYKGGTFTITNLGMFDIDEFTAVINPPESAILAVGKIEKVPVVENDSVVIRPVMVLSLTYDHRIIDGAPAAQFLQRVKQIMQNPYQLI